MNLLTRLQNALATTLQDGETQRRSTTCLWIPYWHANSCDLQLRSKVEHIVETVKGRSQVRKVGMQPVQRDGLEYEFTIVGDLTQEHDLIVTKTRAAFLADAVINKPGRKLGEQLHDWLDAGEAAPPPELVKKIQVNDAYQTAKDFLSNGATSEQRESARKKIKARQEDGTFSFEQATELLELCNKKG